MRGGYNKESKFRKNWKRKASKIPTRVWQKANLGRAFEKGRGGQRAVNRGFRVEASTNAEQ